MKRLWDFLKNILLFFRKKIRNPGDGVSIEEPEEKIPEPQKFDVIECEVTDIIELE